MSWTLNYDAVGEGPPLLFTHGWLMNRTIWERQRPLAAHFELIRWDLPQSGPSGVPLLLKHCAEALHQLVTQLDLKDVTYVGWSMGMSVFWSYLEKFGSEPFSKVVNIEMVPKMDPKESMVDAVDKSMRRDREHAIRKFLSRIFYDVGATGRSPLQEEFVQDACQLPLDSVLSVYCDMAEKDFREASQKFKGSQVIALGRHGFYAQHADLVQGFFPDCSLHWFENSGHAPFWEEPDKFNALLEQFVGH